MRKFLNSNRVLCLSPHPDDVEYAMIGSFLKFTDTHFDIITCSIGGKFDKTSSKSRHVECSNIHEIIPNVSGYFLSEDHLRDMGDDFIVNKIETSFDLSKYDLILLPPQEDTHHDHRKVNLSGMALTRKEKLGVVEYRTPTTVDTWIGNCFIDISELLDEKIELIKKFNSQNHRIYFNDFSIKSFHSNYQCSRRNIGYVEIYKIHRLYDL
jgi:LmbE family N-acetylglucosaminyl deacetylase